ncbi:UDP-glucose/GDP-mannose dehydrogenase [endosymbiont of Acanthamoeba sp. UWC8]|uniref:nucleotide sugar dehydrogenase n=1 Tax=endosymbiont of Acanthamoeba sp. UWC8 TaxID=86106 RepID=UPI0004D108D2|nr:nucleotide sugar dehydrogenase [endosymbiont of Acanthamoeba sp. UWC8]AIF82008.1 UDP-glucose/GDP-mannose dehydrogenase [endosymbiont of Acanthamoeba sp. UWC8]
MTLSTLEKLENKTATIGVIGLGYVGLPIVKAYTKLGMKVIGFDVSQNRIEELKLGKSPIRAVSNETLEEIITNKLFLPTQDFSNIAECTALIICVPTPLDKYSQPDLSYVENSTKTIAKFIKKGQIISLESTTYPGTTEEIVLPILEATGLSAGKDYFLVYSPERENPGEGGHSVETIPKVVSGYTEHCLKAGIQLYKLIVEKVVTASSTKVAEMVKLLENIYRAVNISMVNEMKMIADQMGIDIHEVIDAASTKPFGFTPFYPSPGIGGHCIPVDPFYLTYKAKEFGIHTRFIELAGEINYKVQRFVVNKTISALNNVTKSLNRSKVLIVGIAYKKNVEDMRESPSIHIAQMLAERGAIVDYYDPLILELKPYWSKAMFNIDHKASIKSLENIKDYDIVILHTDHDGIDYNYILENSQLLVDTRGKYRDVPVMYKEKLTYA